MLAARLCFRSATSYICMGFSSFSCSGKSHFRRQGGALPPSRPRKPFYRAEVPLTRLVLPVTDSTGVEAIKRSTSERAPEHSAFPMLNWRTSSRTACRERGCRLFVLSPQVRSAQSSAICGRSKARARQRLCTVMQNVVEKYSLARAIALIATRLRARAASLALTLQNMQQLHRPTEFAVKSSDRREHRATGTGRL